jgi:hypothetical protein
VHLLGRPESAAAHYDEETMRLTGSPVKPLLREICLYLESGVDEITDDFRPRWATLGLGLGGGLRFSDGQA